MSELRQQIRFCASGDGTRIAYAKMGKGPPLAWGPHFLTPCGAARLGRSLESV
jgi:hypothetical protein